MADQSANPNHLELAAEIVSAYVANNSLPQSELPDLLRTVHDALNRTTEDIDGAAHKSNRQQDAAAHRECS